MFKWLMWRLGLRRATIIGLSVAVAVLLGYIRLQDGRVKILEDNAKIAALAYAHPNVNNKSHSERTRGRVVVRRTTHQLPSGERTTTTLVEREPVVERHDEVSQVSTVLPASMLASTRDKWLLGVGNRNFSYRSWQQYSLWAGREFGPIVIQAGAGYHSIETVFLVKFGKR